MASASSLEMLQPRKAPFSFIYPDAGVLSLLALHLQIPKRDLREVPIGSREAILDRLKK